MCYHNCEGGSEFNEASVVCHPPWSVEKLNELNRIVQHICSEGASNVK